MIDDLAARATLTVAAFLVLATGLAVIDLSSLDEERAAREDLAGHLARQIDAIGGLDGVVAVLGGLDVGGPFDLPPTVAGSPYSVTIHSTHLVVESVGGISPASFTHAVHPFPPPEGPLRPGDLKKADRSERVRIEGAAGFVVERAVVDVDGVSTPMTFVHAQAVPP